MNMHDNDPVTILAVVHDVLLSYINQDSVEIFEMKLNVLSDKLVASPRNFCTAIGLIEKTVNQYKDHPELVEAVAKECDG